MIKSSQSSSTALSALLLVKLTHKSASIVWRILSCSMLQVKDLSRVKNLDQKQKVFSSIFVKVSLDVELILADVPAYGSLAHVLSAAFRAAPFGTLPIIITNFVLREENGYVVRWESLECRMRGFELAVKTKSFLDTREEVGSVKVSDRSSLANLISLLGHSVGALFLDGLVSIRC